ncbi:hypothetical protein [Chitinimonas sp.]|uniref:hypothetical protein n=1 Tax=Chitinimonas sp. TaxID=1934313 RepID=UPI0035B4D894
MTLFRRKSLISLALLAACLATHAQPIVRNTVSQLLTQNHNHPGESARLRQAFVEQELIGEEGALIKQRFRQIATAGDVDALLATWQQDGDASRRTAALTLLRELHLPAALPLYARSYEGASQEDRQQLFDLVARIDSPAAFLLLNRWVAQLPAADTAVDLQHALAAAGRFRNPAIRAEAQAARLQSPAQQLLAQETLLALQRPAASTALEAAATLRAEAAVASASDDAGLAARYAPVLRLSSGGKVNLANASYPYIDYLPIAVEDILTRAGKVPNLVAGGTATPLSANLLASLGAAGPNNQPGSYIDLKPVYPGSDTPANAARALSRHPAVYYQLFRDPSKAQPVAIQYWFFYFHDLWLNEHPGDWEGFTVFLDANGNAVEAALSTHYEANRLSWKNMSTLGGHPNIYVANGGHGSYAFSGSTTYFPVVAIDNHKGDKEVLYPAGSGLGGSKDTPYQLLDLSAQGWLGFKGRFGDASSAPNGPVYRTDAPTQGDWNNAKNKPRKPDCSARIGTLMYGTASNPGPWLWAQGYGLDGAACKAS